MKQLLAWKPSRGGDPNLTNLIGQRGGITLYAVRATTHDNKRVELEGYLIGAVGAKLGFDTVEQAQAYAEIDFNDWLKRTKLVPK